MKKQLNKKTIIFSILFLSVFMLFQNTKAETVTASYSLSIGEDIKCENLGHPRYVRSCRNVSFDFDSKNLDGSMNINLTKKINLVKGDGQLLNTTFDLNKTESVNLIEDNTFGNYRLSVNAGAASNGNVVNSLFARPLDDKVYQSGGSVGRLIFHIFTKVSAPVDSINGIKLESSDPNIVECVGKVCTAKNAGSTSIKVSFINQEQNRDSFFSKLLPPLGYGKVIASLRDCVGCALIIDDMKKTALAYSFPSITYNVTVPATANVSQITTCTTPTDITNNGAKISWGYTDTDLQTNYQIQISTSPSFTASTIVESVTAPANTDVSNIRSVIISGLNQNTTYYSRIRTYNSANGWSEYTNCGGSFKTNSDSSGETCGCENRDLICKVNGTQSKPSEKNAAQCAFNAVCDIPTLSSGNTNFRIIPDKSLGSIRYERVGGSPVTLPNTQSYTHSTTTIVVGSQSITVRAIDLYDNSEVTRTCVYNSNTTPPSPANINLSKTPLVTMNRGSDCTLYWEITDMPEDAVCTLTSKGVISLQNGFSKDSYSEKLNSNKKFTLTCSGGTLSKPVSRNTICRVNPEIREN